jgi:phage/plasmid-like protein (TIGR03299 family)
MHNIFMNNGKASFAGVVAAWHQLGVTLGQHATKEEILKAAGCDYSIFKSQLRDGRGNPVPAWSTFRWNAEDVATKDGSKAVWLGNVGEDYTILPHQIGFEMVDEIIQADTEQMAHWSTCGALGNGERVFGCANLNMSINVGEDKHENYLLFSTGHDGSLGFSFRQTNVRVVCQNTLSMALSGKTTAMLSIRHTKNAKARIADVRATLESIRNDVQSAEERLRFLASRRMDRPTLTAVLDRLFPKTKKDMDGNDQSSTKRDNILADVLRLYESNDHGAFPEQAGTSYALLNAVTNFTDHLRSSKNDQRALSATFGSGDALKVKALEVITLASNGLAMVPSRQTFAVPSTGGTSLLDMIASEQAV